MGGECTTLGRRVSIRSGQHLLEGRAEALDEDGALLLRTIMATWNGSSVAM